MKKIISIVIALTMIMAMLVPFGIYASAAGPQVITSWAEITDAKGNYKLGADITADATFASTFKGTLDGDGHTITTSVTLFAKAGEGAKFNNLTIASASELTAVPFLAEAEGTVAITNVTVAADANVNAGNVAAFIGKVSAAANIIFTNCVNDADITGNGNVGGFIGFAGSALTATFEECVNNATVSTVKKGGHAGGFIGCLEKTSAAFDITFNSCINAGKIFGDSVKNETAGYMAFTSGNADSTFTFNNCLSMGELDSDSTDDSDKYSASGFISRTKKGTVSFNNCLSNIATMSSGTNRTANYWFYNEGATLNVNNSYYIEGVALSAAEANKGFTAVTAAQLASGEVAFNLNKRLDTVVNWYQEIGVDAAPSPIGEEVVSLDENGNYVNGYVHEHSWTAWFTTKAATCTENGVKTRTCTCSCEAYEDKIIPATGHTEEIVEGYAASCTEPGLTDGVICSDCGETLVAQEEIPATGHTEEVVAGKAPTCTETGLTDGVICSVCGETLLAQEEIPANGHTYEAVVTAPTCTEAGYTTYTCACGDTYVADEVAATGHSYETVVTAPTCTEAGYTTYTCACGDTYKADEVAATGHTYGEWVITKEPTTEAEGEKTRTCACGATETVAIDKLEVPETADNTNIAVFAIVAVATMGCAVVVIKKREN